jgi:hypothetical protein
MRAMLHPRDRPQPASEANVSIGLTAAVAAVTDEEPRILVVRQPGSRDALPAGPLEPHHRTLDAGLRAWVEAQTEQRLGYVEQLYTFGDRDRQEGIGPDQARIVSVGYLALVREMRPSGAIGAVWQSWYRYFPWEDWRGGRPAIFAAFETQLQRWAAEAPSEGERRTRQDRLRINFGLRGAAWNDERVLDRYELLYEAGMVAEARHDRRADPALVPLQPDPDEGMAADHRRILATAIARLRGKIKYRPVVFELMPPTFTLLQLQRAVEALAGVRLHKQNFRRLVEQQGLVEETGDMVTGTGGRPAREVRFRREVLLERLAPGVKLPVARRRR